MRKSILASFLLGLILLSFSAKAVADAITVPIVHSTLAISRISEDLLAEDNMLINLATGTLGAISISGTADIGLDSKLTNITVRTTQNDLAESAAIRVFSTTASSLYTRPILTVNDLNAPNYTLNIIITGESDSFFISGKSVISGIHVRNNGLFKINGDLKISIESSHGIGIDVFGVDAGNIDRIEGKKFLESASFNGAVDITIDDGLDITSNSNEKVGVLIGRNAIVNFHDALTINIKDNLGVAGHTGSNNVYGIFVQNSSNVFIGGKTTITVDGHYSIGIINLASRMVFNDDVDITAIGEYSRGIDIYPTSNPSYTLFKGDLTVDLSAETPMASPQSVHNAFVIRGASGIDGVLLEVKGHTKITVDSVGARGLSFTSRSADNKVVLNTVEITTESNKSGAMYIDGGDITFGATKITTEGNESSGIYITNTVNYRGSHVFGSLDITTKGNDSRGMYIINDSPITVLGKTTIKTTGNTSNGITMLGGSASFKGNVNIKTDGSGAHGIQFSHPSSTDYSNFVPKVELNGATITTNENNSYPIYFTIASMSPGRESVFLDVILNASNGGNGRAIVNGRNNYNLALSFSGDSQINGQIHNTGGSYAGTTTLNLSGGSFLKGGTANLESEVNAKTNIILTDDAYWVIAGNYRLNNVDMESFNNRIFFPSKNTAAYKATIEHLSGEGTFVMNANADQDDSSADLVLSKTANGTFKIDVKDKTPSHATLYADTIDLVIVSDVSSVAPDISLNESLGVLLGHQFYTLDSSVLGSEKTWFLTKASLPEEIIIGTHGSLNGLFEFAKSIDATLSDNMFSTSRNIWGTTIYKEQNFRNLEEHANLNQTILGLIGGKCIDREGDWYIGAFTAIIWGKQDVNKLVIAKTASYHLGLNAIYDHNDFIASGYVRLSNYQHTPEVVGNDNLYKGTMSLYGASASIQATKNIRIGDHGFYIAPKAKATFTHLFGSKYDFILLTVESKGASSLILWAGGIAGINKVIKDVPFNFYVEAGYIFDTNPKLQVLVNDVEKDLIISGHRFEIGCGLSVQSNDITTVEFEYKYLRSEKLIEPIKLKFTITTMF